MKTRSLALVLGAVLAALAASSGVSAAAHAAGSPEKYLLLAQNRNGGFGPARGQPSTELYAGWVALGLAAKGYDAADVSRRGGKSLLDYVRAGVASISDPGSLERTILVASAAGQSASSFGGRDLIAELDRDIKRDGSVANQTNWTAFAVLALRSAGITPSATTLGWLARQQDRDGGFNFETAGGESDVDDTGAVLEALAGDATARTVISRAAKFIRRKQDRDGGFPSQPGAGSNAQSTAFAVQGLIAANVHLTSMPHGSPERYLRGLIGSNGAVAYSRGIQLAPVWVTGEALMALAGKALPLAPSAR